MCVCVCVCIICICIYIIYYIMGVHIHMYIHTLHISYIVCIMHIYTYVTLYYIHTHTHGLPWLSLNLSLGDSAENEGPTSPGQKQIRTVQGRWHCPSQVHTLLRQTSPLQGQVTSRPRHANVGARSHGRLVRKRQNWCGTVGENSSYWPPIQT